MADLVDRDVRVTYLFRSCLRDFGTNRSENKGFDSGLGNNLLGTRLSPPANLFANVTVEVEQYSDGDGDSNLSRTPLIYRSSATRTTARVVKFLQLVAIRIPL